MMYIYNIILNLICIKRINKKYIIQYYKMLSVPTVVYSTIGLLTINMLNGIIIGTTSTLKTIYYLLPSSNPHLKMYKNEIELLDIEFKLKIIQNWLEENKKNTDAEFNNYKDEVANLCIKISNNLDAINKKISYHNTKWFSSWRTLDLDDQIDNLKNSTTILNNRIHYYNLIKTYNIKENVNDSNNTNDLEKQKLCLTRKRSQTFA